MLRIFSTYYLDPTLGALPVYFLGFEQFHRYEFSRQNEELDQPILQLTEAILLPHLPWGGPRADITEIFFWLAMALLRRSEKSKQPMGVNSTTTSIGFKIIPLKHLVSHGTAWHHS